MTACRSFKTDRVSERRRDAAEADQTTAESVLDSIDPGTVARILRGLADAADTWGRTEL